MSCIKVTASRGSGSCIRINAILGGYCINVTANKEDVEVPDIQTSEIIIAFECYDIIGHGLNQFMAIGRYTETTDGIVTREEKQLASFTAIVGIGTAPVSITNFDTSVIVPDLTELCYLNAFDVSSGLDNVAIVYEGGTKVRYFDGLLLNEISYITNRHGYVFDAFHYSDDTYPTESYTTQSISYPNTTKKTIYNGQVEDYYSGGCSTPFVNCAPAENMINTYLPDAEDFVIPSSVGTETAQVACYSYGGSLMAFYAKGEGALTVSYLSPSTGTYSKKRRDVYSIDYNVKSVVDTGIPVNTLTYSYYNFTDSNGYHAVESYSNTTLTFDATKYAGRDGIEYFNGVILDSPYYTVDETLSRNYTHKKSVAMGTVCREGNLGVIINELDVIGYIPKTNNQIQLNGGDPHKVQTGSDYIGIGSACISIDRAFVCENLPTSPCGKTGAIVGDRVVIPIDAESGSGAMFALDQTFVISYNKTPSQFVV